MRAFLIAFFLPICAASSLSQTDTPDIVDFENESRSR